ncbi:MAG: hypothetical protein WBK28_00930 [Minisyncoccia bacterium]
MKGSVVGIVIVLALIAAGALFYAGSALTPTPPAPIEQLYSNGTYGISFSYPSGYVLSEKRTIEDGAHHITVVKETDTVPEGGEGPPALSLDIYPIPKDTETITDFIETASISNFGLGDGTYTTLLMGSTNAVRYAWSGLYEGETVAFLHNGRVIMISVTFISPTDPIRTDFDALLTSLRLR